MLQSVSAIIFAQFGPVQNVQMFVLLQWSDVDMASVRVPWSQLWTQGGTDINIFHCIPHGWSDARALRVAPCLGTSAPTNIQTISSKLTFASLNTWQFCIFNSELI